MGFVVSGLVIILYIILYKVTKGELLHPFFLRTGECQRDRAIGTVILVILGIYVSLTFLLSYLHAYIFRLKYLRLHYLLRFALAMGSVVSGLGIILYKWTKGELLRPFFLRTGERKRYRAIGAVMLVILGIYIPLTFQLVRLPYPVGAMIFAPLSDEFICRVLLPYAFLLTFARIPWFAKQERWGLPLLLVVSHLLAALIFAIGHLPVHIGPFFDFYAFFRFFSFGIACSCVFLLFFALADSTTGYTGAVLAHGLINWGILGYPLFL